MASINDYKILSAILDPNDPNKGILKNRGTTREEIQKITDMSYTKIGTTLIRFEKEGCVERGLSIGRTHTYVITDLGLDKLNELSGGIPREGSEDN